MTAAKPARAGVSAKVSNAGVSGALAVGITWALTYYIPAWHSGIPPSLEPLVVGGAGLIVAWVGGYFSTHRATTPEILAALDKARTLLAADGQPVPAVPDPAPAVTGPPAADAPPHMGRI